MDINEITVFDGKTLGDLFKEIYFNSIDKREKIQDLIEDLRPFLKTIQEAAILVPIIKEYMEVSVKNDEHLIKLATVVQRLYAIEESGTPGNEYGISDEEKRHLVSQAEEYYKKVMEENRAEQGGNK